MNFKILLFFLILLFNQFLMFCSDSTSSKEEELVGTWNLEELLYKSSDSTLSYSPVELNYYYTYIFKDDNKYISKFIRIQPSETIYNNGYWKISGNKLKLVDELNNKTEMKYSIINNKLTTQFEEIVIQGELVQLSHVFFKE